MDFSFWIQLDYKMADHMVVLRNATQSFAVLDDQIIALNRQLSELRLQRKRQEEQIVNVLRLPEYSTYNRLSVSADNSTIKVYRPREWNKAWTLPKSTLLDLLRRYFQQTTNANAEDCYRMIVDSNTVMAETFSIERSAAQ